MRMIRVVQQQMDLIFGVAAEDAQHIAAVACVHADEIVVVRVILAAELHGVFPLAGDTAGLKQGADGRIDGVSNLVAGVGGGRDDPVKPLLAHELLHDQLGHGAAADISGADEHDSNHWLADPFFSDGSSGATSTTVSRPSETVK